MASHTIPLIKYGGRIPIHAALAPERDLLAVLYEDGRLSVWELQTRLGPGEGKVMNPRLISDDLKLHGQPLDMEHVLWRQISVRGIENGWDVYILGAGPSGDVVQCILVSPDGMDTRKMGLPQSGGRLSIGSSSIAVWWEGPSGEISSGKSFKLEF